jgi:hypothetical protein
MEPTSPARLYLNAYRYSNGYIDLEHTDSAGKRYLIHFHVESQLMLFIKSCDQQHKQALIQKRREDLTKQIETLQEELKKLS